MSVCVCLLRISRGNFKYTSGLNLGQKAQSSYLLVESYKQRVVTLMRVLTRR